MIEKNELNNEATKFEESEQSMADLMKSESSIGDLGVGKEIDATIIAQTADGFLLDLGTKTEGIILKSDYQDEKIPDELKVGQTVRVKIMDMRGQPKLSRKEVFKKEKWESVSKFAQSQKQISGLISKAIKGGFIVDIDGLKAFLPISQIENHFVKDTEKYIGKTYQFVITEFNRAKEKITVSRRKVLEDEKLAKKKSILETLAEGQILDGTVSNFARLKPKKSPAAAPEEQSKKSDKAIKNDKSKIFGAFINLGGIDGLLHVDEMAWHRVTNPEEVLRIGQTVRVQVIKFDKEHEKISLSIKSLMTNPWDAAAEKYPVGMTLKGKVVSVIDYGAFIELEKGVDGFLHNSEYSWNDSEYAFKKNVKKGQELEVKIISADLANKKIGLSVKQTLPNPWDDVYKHYSPGAKVKGIVQNLTPFGAFVELPGGIEGLVHISDFSWTKKINHPADVVKKGDEVEVIVLEVNSQKEQISLSIKHTMDDPYKKYKVGNVVKGKVIKQTDFGYFIELEPGIEALIKSNDISFQKSQDNTKSAAALNIGDEVEAKITGFDIKDRKIKASVKKLEMDREKELVKKYANQDNRPTLGDILLEEDEEESADE
jgi:small subunit ribosomal protein S1